MNTKICKTCGINKSLDEYYSSVKNSKTKGVYTWYQCSCKECCKERSKKWINDNKDRYITLIKERDGRSETIIYHRELSKKRRLEGKHKEWNRKNPDKLREYNIYRTLHKNHQISKAEWESCKLYFNNACAYCGLPADKHYCNYMGNMKLMSLHKEHVKHDGDNDLSNCIPACKACNSSKHTEQFEEWYFKQDFYSKEKYDKVIMWIEEDYKMFLDNKQKHKVSWHET